MLITSECLSGEFMSLRMSLRLLQLESRFTPAAGYFRIASYNIGSSDGAPATGLNTILQAIGNEAVVGQSAQLDLIALQEVESQSTTTQAVVNLMNGLYGAGAYGRGSVNGASTGSGTLGVVYNTQTLQLLGETRIGTASTAGQPRQAMRYNFRPIGYTSADFYVYVSHFKADDDATSQNRRLVEANALRADADGLGQGVQVLYVGDFNVYSSAETAYQRLLSTGNGQALDPINRPGAWHDSSSFVDIHTQAPAVNPPAGLTGGGLDDRFDFQLVSSELTNGVGFEYVPNTYRAFGNNGSVPLNGNINASSSTALPGLSNRIQVLNLLTTVTDHLPVVADYRVITPPVVTGVQVGDGTSQRSKVGQLKVSFDQVVQYVSGPLAAFTVQKIANGSPAGLVSIAVSTATVGGHTEATITFTSDISFGSLFDGRYRLIVNANQVRVGNTPMAANHVANFHRMYGDVNGDAQVDGVDFSAFSSTYGLMSTQIGFLAFFDLNGDGQIDGFEFSQFSGRVFTTLP